MRGSYNTVLQPFPTHSYKKAGAYLITSSEVRFVSAKTKLGPISLPVLPLVRPKDLYSARKHGSTQQLTLIIEPSVNKPTGGHIRAGLPRG